MTSGCATLQSRIQTFNLLPFQRKFYLKLNQVLSVLARVGVRGRKLGENHTYTHTHTQNTNKYSYAQLISFIYLWNSIITNGHPFVCQLRLGGIANYSADKYVKVWFIFEKIPLINKHL